MVSTIINAFCLISVIAGWAMSSSPFQELEDRKKDYPTSEDQEIYRSINASLRSPLPNHQTNPLDYYDDYIEHSKNNFRRNSNYGKDRYYNNQYENEEGENRKTPIFRTYGRGKAQVTRRGETVVVPNELGRRNAYRGALRVIDRNENEGRVNGRGRCKECPADQTVVASKGNDFVILPEPCPSNPRMWNLQSGPRPGTKIREGVHVIRGTLGAKKRYCEYQYQVLVSRCEALKGREEDTTIECTKENVWGSECTVTCGHEKVPMGPTVLECMEDLTWSHPVPACKSKRDCSMPKVKVNSKIWCQTANMTEAEGDFIPNGSTCRFHKNGREVSLNCKEGVWRLSRKMKKSKEKLKNKMETDENPCNPNPCQNGGTCLRPKSNQGSPFCLCRPQTQGAKCEMRECDYNICHNEGLCFFINNERTCYCMPEYSGDQCQHHNY